MGKTILNKSTGAGVKGKMVDIWCATIENDFSKKVRASLRDTVFPCPVNWLASREFPF